MWRLIIERGPGAGLWLLALAAQMSGFTNVAIALGLLGLAAIFFIAPASHHVRAWWRRRREQGHPGLSGAQVLLLIGLAGCWLFVTVTLGAMAWLLLGESQAVTASASAAKEPGPLQWLHNVGMEGGQNGMNVFSLRFFGANTSNNPVQIKDGKIVSLIDGSITVLEIIAVDPATGQNASVQLTSSPRCSRSAPAS